MMTGLIHRVVLFTHFINEYQRYEHEGEAKECSLSVGERRPTREAVVLPK